MYEHLKKVIFGSARKALGVENRRTKYVEKFPEELEDLIKEKTKSIYEMVSR